MCAEGRPVCTSITATSSSTTEPWLSVAQLPHQAGLISPVSWEHRHCSQIFFRDRLQQDTVILNDHGMDLWNSSETFVPIGRFPLQIMSIQESDLVGRCMQALEGVPIAVSELEFISRAFTHQTADISSHRLSNLWQRSVSTKAIGKTLFIFSQAGQVRCKLDEFVDYFLKPTNVSAGHLVVEQEMEQIDKWQRKKCKQKKKYSSNAVSIREDAINLSPPFTLVNQAFAKAVKNILQGHLAALNMMTSSVSHRRAIDSSKSMDQELTADCLGAVLGLPSGEITLLELHLHTIDLRLQLQVLASLCLHTSSHESSITQNSEVNGGCLDEGELAILDGAFSNYMSGFSRFYKGADLLTFLYKQLKEADTIHIELLQYLFSCACQPYLMFIQSWLYCASVKDPYQEFIIDEVLARSGLTSLNKVEQLPSLTHLKVRESVSVPCFLQDICTPLLRAGHQLQVLLQLGDTCNLTGVSHGLGVYLDQTVVAMLKDALKCWTDFSSGSSIFPLILLFRKEKLERLMQERAKQRHGVMQKFDTLFSRPSSDPEVQMQRPTLSCSILELERESSGDHGGNMDGIEPLAERDMVQDECIDLSEIGLCPFEPEVSAPIKESVEQMSGCYRAEEPTKGQSLISGLVRKERKKWAELCDVTIVHGISEADILMLDLEDTAASEIRHSWLLNGLSKAAQTCNAWQVTEVSSSFLGRDCSYGLTWTAHCKSLNRPLLQPLGRYECEHPNISLISGDLSLDKSGTNLLLGHSFLRRLGQVYGYRNDEGARENSYTKGLLNFDEISQNLLNFEAGLSNEMDNVRILPVFSSGDDLSSIRKADPECSDNMLEDEDKVTGMECKDLGGSTHGTIQLQSSYFVESALDSSEPSIIADLVEADSVVQSQHLDVKKKSGTMTGGATWESYLMSVGEPEPYKSEERELEKDEIPVEIVIDKCIIQEVLSQYQFISYFTVRLLHDVFGLQHHFTALRRYFFMERGDWADNFAAALYQHAWYPIESQQRQLEVQALLEAALQNSSCEKDGYAERLHVFIAGSEDQAKPVQMVQEEVDASHTYVNKNCISAFAFIMLGYRVEWPINLILTSECLELYNMIFKFLIRIKLTVHALNDMWHYLKEVFNHEKRCNMKCGALHSGEDQVRCLVVFRHQISHFITTLQGHVESQLLHNTWSHFLKAMHEEVKDLQDLEAVHKAYLKDGLKDCFLSNDSKSVKDCIDDIMQCLLNLSGIMYCAGRCAENGLPKMRNEKMQFAIFEAKTQFETSMQRLYRLGCESYTQKGLNQFWDHLDFNGFVGQSFSKI